MKATRAVLEHRDELVAGGRDDDAQRLRKDDAAHRLSWVMPRLLRGVHLAALHREDAGAHDLRHVGAFVDAEGDDGGAEGGQLGGERLVVEHCGRPK